MKRIVTNIIKLHYLLRKRDCFVKDNGFKVIRIKSTTKNPTKEQLKEAIDVLINSDKTFIEINLIDKNKE